MCFWICQLSYELHVYIYNIYSEMSTRTVPACNLLLQIGCLLTCNLNTTSTASVHLRCLRCLTLWWRLQIYCYGNDTGGSCLLKGQQTASPLSMIFTSLVWKSKWFDKLPLGWFRVMCIDSACHTSFLHFVVNGWFFNSQCIVWHFETLNWPLCWDLDEMKWG